MDLTALKITTQDEADHLEEISEEAVVELTAKITSPGATVEDYWEALRLLNRAGVCARVAQEWRREYQEHVDDGQHGVN